MGSPDSPAESSLAEEVFLGLVQFAEPEDVTCFNTVSLMEEAGLQRTSFRRGNFHPTNNPLSRALSQYEGGREGNSNPEALAVLNGRLLHELGISIEVATQPRGDSSKIIITHVILLHRGRLSDVLLDPLE